MYSAAQQFCCLILNAGHMIALKLCLAQPLTQRKLSVSGVTNRYRTGKKKRTKQKPDIPSGLEIDDEAGYWQHCCAAIIESKKKKAYLQLIPGP